MTKNIVTIDETADSISNITVESEADSISTITVESADIEWNTVRTQYDNDLNAFHLNSNNLNLPSEIEKPSISISSIALQNSTDITFGNKTLYSGPITVNQYGIEAKSKFGGKTLLFLKRWKLVLIIAVIVSAIALFTAILLTSLLTKPEDETTKIPSIDDDNSELKFITREQWGAQPPTGKIDDLNTPVQLVIIQHTVQSTCDSLETCAPLVRQAQIVHIYNNEIEDDIGYNFLVGGDGAAYEGRGWDKVGAHARGFNSRSIGVAFIGDFRDVDPANQQIIALLKLIRDGVAINKISENYTLIGACQVKQTESPGPKLYKVLTKLPHYSDDVSWLIEYDKLTTQT